MLHEVAFFISVKSTRAPYHYVFHLYNVDSRKIIRICTVSIQGLTWLLHV